MFPNLRSYSPPPRRADGFAAFGRIYARRRGRVVDTGLRCLTGGAALTGAG